MREYLSAAACGVLVTVVAGAALAGGDPVVVVLAVAATLAALAWATAQLSYGTEAGIGVANVAWAVGLAVRGRTAPGRLLPLAAAQVVGAGVGGLMLLAVGGTYADPPGTIGIGAVTAGALGLVVGVVAGLAAVLADLHAADAGAGVGALAGAALPGPLTVAVHPAALLGLAVAGSLGWTMAAVSVLTVLIGHALAGLWCRALVPA